MNKLLYNETIKHIDRSIIEISDNYTYASDDITLHVKNPISGRVIYFTKNIVPLYHKVSYKVSFGELYDNPFTAAESKQLFEYAEKRYNAYFRDAREETVYLYKVMLISNNMTRSR